VAGGVRQPQSSYQGLPSSGDLLCCVLREVIPTAPIGRPSAGKKVPPEFADSPTDCRKEEQCGRPSGGILQESRHLAPPNVPPCTFGSAPYLTTRSSCQRPYFPGEECRLGRGAECASYEGGHQSARNSTNKLCGSTGWRRFCAQNIARRSTTLRGIGSVFLRTKEIA